MADAGARQGRAAAVRPPGPAEIARRTASNPRIWARNPFGGLFAARSALAGILAGLGDFGRLGDAAHFSLRRSAGKFFRSLLLADPLRRGAPGVGMIAGLGSIFKFKG